MVSRAKCGSSIFIVRLDDRCRPIRSIDRRYMVVIIMTSGRSFSRTYSINSFNDSIKAYLTEHVFRRNAGIFAPVLYLAATMHLHGCFRQELINVNVILCTRKWNCRNMKILSSAGSRVFFLSRFSLYTQDKVEKNFSFFLKFFLLSSALVSLQGEILIKDQEFRVHANRSLRACAQ